MANEISGVGRRLSNKKAHTIQNRLHKMELFENTLKHVSPEAILKRGYSITLANGRVVKKASDVGPGVELRTLLSEGEIVSVTK